MCIHIEEELESHYLSWWYSDDILMSSFIKIDTTTKNTYDNGFERHLMTVVCLLLGSVWLQVFYLQPQSIVYYSKLESSLPITTVVLNNRSETFVGLGSDT